MQLNIQELLEFAKQIAVEAGKITLQYFNQKLEINHKDVINNLVTEADLATERYILAQIQQKYPDHNIISEEYHAQNGRKGQFNWFIDPIDGTTNFAHSFPFYAVSIALEIDGEVVLGVTHAPKRNELFWAAKGQGAYLNGEKIQVSTNQSLELSLLETGFPPNRNSDDYSKAIDLFTRTQRKIHGVRRLGSACLALAYTACGRLDGFFEIGLKPWDTAAGIVLINEANGKITCFEGKDFDCFENTIIATNGLIHTELSDYLNQ